MAAITLRNGLGRNLTPNEVDANFTALNDENAAQQTTLNSRAPLASPAFTGTPTAPTPFEDDDSTRLATTAWVLGQGSDDLPLDNSDTASAGTSAKWARADHVHVGGGSGGTAAQNALTPGSDTVPPTVNAVVSALALKADINYVDGKTDTLTTALNDKFDASDIADQATGEGGTDNTKLMTSLRTKQLVQAVVPLIEGNTTEVLGMSGFGFIVPNALGSANTTAVGLIEGTLDSSVKTSYGTPANGIGNYRRNMWRSVSALNRVSGVATNNGYCRIGSPWSETTIVAGLGDANYASGTAFIGLLHSQSAVSPWTTAQPSAVAFAYIGVGVDESDSTWKVMWRPTGTGTITKVDTLLPRSQHTMLVVYIKPANDMASTFVRVTRMSHGSGLVLDSFEYTITANLPTASGSDWQRVAARSTMNGVAGDGVTAFAGDLAFGGLYCGRLPALTVSTGGGGGTEDTSATRVVTASGALIASDVNCTIQTNSSSPVELSLPSLATLGATAGKATISVYVNGTGVTTIVPQNGVDAPVGTPPSGAQGTFVTITHVGDKWVYPA
jgi:hypothetical protein